jgi:lysophospholipase L1-like esterase
MRFRRVVLVAAALCVGSFAAGELALRVIWKPPPDLAKHVFARPPHIRLRVTIERDMAGLARRSSWFTTNALGVRGDELDLRVRDRKRVLTLGDSVTECLLLDDAAAWHRRLQDRLVAATSGAVWVGNAGSSGHLSLDYIVHMRVLVPAFAPDLVIVMPGGYDLQAALEEKLLPMDLADPAKLADYAARLYAPQNLAGSGPSYLGSFLRTLAQPEHLDMTGFYERMRAKRAAAHEKLGAFPGIEDALDVYTSNLRALVVAWRALRPRPRLLLATSPSLWKARMPPEEVRALWGGYTCMDCPDPRYYGHEFLAATVRRFHDALLDVCRREDVPCLDLDRFIAKDLEHFYDDAHLTEAGANAVAARIAEFIGSRRPLE